MTVKTVPEHEAAPTISTKIISMSYGCKSPDGQHIYGENGRCLICWRMKADTQTSRVLMLVISAENSEQRRVDELAAIVASQVRGVFNTVALIQRESHNAAQKPVELEVYA